MKKIILISIISVVLCLAFISAASAEEINIEDINTADNPIVIEDQTLEISTDEQIELNDKDILIKNSIITLNVSEIELENCNIKIVNSHFYGVIDELELDNVNFDIDELSTFDVEIKELEIDDDDDDDEYELNNKISMENTGNPLILLAACILCISMIFTYRKLKI